MWNLLQQSNLVGIVPIISRCVCLMHKSSEKSFSFWSFFVASCLFVRKTNVCHQNKIADPAPQEGKVSSQIQRKHKTRLNYCRHCGQCVVLIIDSSQNEVWLWGCQPFFSQSACRCGMVSSIFFPHCRGNIARIGSFDGNVSNQKSCMEALSICMAILFILFSRQHFDGIIDRCENFPMVALIYGRDCPECSHSRPFIRNNVLHFFSQTGMFILRWWCWFFWWCPKFSDLMISYQES